MNAPFALDDRIINRNLVAVTMCERCDLWIRFLINVYEVFFFQISHGYFNRKKRFGHFVLFIFELLLKFNNIYNRFVKIINARFSIRNNIYPRRNPYLPQCNFQLKLFTSAQRGKGRRYNDRSRIEKFLWVSVCSHEAVKSASGHIWCGGLKNLYPSIELLNGCNIAFLHRKQNVAPHAHIFEPRRFNLPYTDHICCCASEYRGRRTYYRAPKASRIFDRPSFYRCEYCRQGDCPSNKNNYNDEGGDGAFGKFHLEKMPARAQVVERAA